MPTATTPPDSDSTRPPERGPATGAIILLLILASFMLLGLELGKADDSDVEWLRQQNEGRGVQIQQLRNDVARLEAIIAARDSLAGGSTPAVGAPDSAAIPAP